MNVGVAKKLKLKRKRMHALGALGRDHIIHLDIDFSPVEIERRKQRAAAVQRAKSPPDPEKEQMSRRIVELESQLQDVTRYLHQRDVQQSAPVSFLDEAMLSLDAKLMAKPVETVELPDSLFAALSEDE